MRLWTDATDEKSVLDPRYSCDLDNSSPELRWEEVPEGISGFVLLLEDQDHLREDKPFCHWVVYEIPNQLRHLPAGIPPQDSLPNGLRQGLNDYGKLGYAGPCPPKDDPAHHFVVRLLAVRIFPPELPNRLTRAQLLSAIDGHIAEESRLEFIYQRQWTLERAG